MTQREVRRNMLRLFGIGRMVDAANKTGPSKQRLKLLGSLALIVILFVTVPLLFSYFGVVALSPQAPWVLFTTIITLILGTLLGDYSSGQFEYHRHGFELCVFAMGAVLSTLSLQILVGVDLLPNLPTGGPFEWMQRLAPDSVVTQRRVFLVALLLLAIVFSLIAAGNSRATVDEIAKTSNPKARSGFSLVNFALGYIALLGYVTLLIGG
jgi:hypothetical protein